MNVYIDVAGRRRHDMTGFGVYDEAKMTIKEGDVFYHVSCQRKWQKRRFKVQIPGEVAVKITSKKGVTTVEVIGD